jgi:hypothetical protein
VEDLGRWLVLRRPKELVGAGLAGGLGVVAAVVLGSAWVDAIALVAGLVWAVSLGLVHRGAHAWRSRPLILAERAVWSWQDGERLVRFQGWLGDGRRCRPLEAEVLFLPEAGEPRRLSATLPSGPAVGPFVVSAAHPEGGAPAGRYQVRVVVSEGGRTWSAARELAAADLVPGRFAPALIPGSPRLRFRPADFGAVEVWPAAVPDALVDEADEAWQG